MSTPDPTRKPRKKRKNARRPGSLHPGEHENHGSLTRAVYAEVVRLARLGYGDTVIGPMLGSARKGPNGTTIPPVVPGGLDRSIVSKWRNMAKGRKSGVYFNLVADIDSAEPFADDISWKTIVDAQGEKDWHAAAARLRMKHPAKFAQQTNVVNYTPEQWEAFTHDQLERIANGKDPFTA